MKKYVAFCEKFNQVLTFVGVLILVFAIMLTFVQVCLRNLTGYSFKWAEELTRYLVIYVVYLASGHVFYINGNSTVDMFYNMFPKSVQKALTCLFYVLIAVFLVIMLRYGYVLVSRNMKVWCASIHIPWAVPFASLIVGAVNMLIQLPAKIYKTIKEID